jgi:long-chain acyl-CoA synthetase
LCVNCPESPDTVVEDRREIGTTYAFAPPRVFETMLTLSMVRMEDASALKRRVFRFFIDHANKVGERILNREPESAPGTASSTGSATSWSTGPCATASG